jgi:YHS domain-containing protein
MKDPVCGRDVMPASDSPSAEYRHRRFHFCSENCRVAFIHATAQMSCREAARGGTLLSPGVIRWGRA